MTTNSDYAFPIRALRRWRDERLVLVSAPDGGIEATFRFEGSTCGNVPFVVLFSIRLAPPEDSHRILQLDCSPAPGDSGHRQMCAFREDASTFLAALRSEATLPGQPLDAVLDWRPVTTPAGCVCTESDRAHKWLAILHTLHFALKGPQAAPSALP